MSKLKQDRSDGGDAFTCVANFSSPSGAFHADTQTICIEDSRSTVLTWSVNGIHGDSTPLC
jgi:hypothetical protein